MTTGLIIFARLDSSRLPGKMLLPIGSRPLLGHVIDRANLVPGDAPIVVATSDRTVDDPIAEFARKEEIDVFRGDLEDVAQRALDCARRFGFSRFARICGDRPFHDPGILGQAIELHCEMKCDLATTMSPRTLPPGLTVEVVSTEAMEQLVQQTTRPDDREHVTAYFYRHPEEFRICNLDPPDAKSLDGLNLVVDDQHDLKRARWIVQGLGETPERTPISRIADLARTWDRQAA